MALNASELALLDRLRVELRTAVQLAAQGRMALAAECAFAAATGCSSMTAQQRQAIDSECADAEAKLLEIGERLGALALLGEPNRPRRVRSVMRSSRAEALP